MNFQTAPEQGIKEVIVNLKPVSLMQLVRKNNENFPELVSTERTGKLGCRKHDVETLEVSITVLKPHSVIAFLPNIETIDTSVPDACFLKYPPIETEFRFLSQKIEYHWQNWILK